MTRQRVHALAFLVASGVAAAAQQSPNLSGTWQLDAARSRIDAAAGLAGLIASGVPNVLHVTHAANGTLVVESQINEGHARIYKPGGRTSTPAGATSTITVTSTWNGRALVGEGTHESTAGTTTLVRQVKEAFALNGDGTLTIEVATTGSDKTASSTLVYTRLKSVGSCQSWPTPCKSFP